MLDLPFRGRGMRCTEIVPPERQRGVAEVELRRCLSETDNNILREDNRLSVIPITGEERCRPAERDGEVCFLILASGLTALVIWFSSSNKVQALP
jgi:hypothetical protein